MELVFIDGADHLGWDPHEKWVRDDTYLGGMYPVDRGGSYAGKYYEAYDAVSARSGAAYADYAYALWDSYFGQVILDAPITWSEGVIGFHFQPFAAYPYSWVDTGHFLVGRRWNGTRWVTAWSVGVRQDPGNSGQGRLELNNHNDGTADPAKGPATYTDYDLLQKDTWIHLEVVVHGGTIKLYAAGTLVAEDTVSVLGTRIAIMRAGFFWGGWKWDNVFVFADDGGAVAPVGECRVATTFANADQISEWTGNGSHPNALWNRVWEHARLTWNDPDGTHADFWSSSLSSYSPDLTTYVEATGSSDLDLLLRWPNAKLIGGQLLGVQVNAVCAIIDPAHTDNASNDASVQLLSRAGASGTLLAGTAQQCIRHWHPRDTTREIWLNHRWMLTAAPDTTPWTEAQLIGSNAWQFGLRYKPVVSSPYVTPVRCAQLCEERLFLGGSGGGTGARYTSF